MNTVNVGSELEVLFFVDPRGSFSQFDGLVGLEVRLLFIDAGELVERDVRQTVEQRIGGQAVETDLAGYVGGVGEVVRRLRIAAVPDEVEVVGEVTLADGVAERERIIMALRFSAEAGEDADLVAGGVAQVEIGVEVLVESGAALTHDLTDEVANGGIVASAAEVVDEARAEGGGVGFGGGDFAVVLELARQVGQRDVVQQVCGLRRNALAEDGVVREGLPRIGIARVAAGIIDGDGLAALRGQSLKFSRALGERGDGSIFVERLGRALTGEREEK